MFDLPVSMFDVDNLLCLCIVPLKKTQRATYKFDIEQTQRGGHQVQLSLNCI